MKKFCDICGDEIPETKEWKHDKVVEEFNAAEVILMRGILCEGWTLCGDCSIFIEMILKGLKKKFESQCGPS